MLLPTEQSMQYNCMYIYCSIKYTVGYNVCVSCVSGFIHILVPLISLFPLVGGRVLFFLRSWRRLQMYGSDRVGRGVKATQHGLPTAIAAMRNQNKKSTLTWRQSGTRFLEEVSVAGVRFIVSDESTLLRKCIWFFLVLLGGGFMIFQVFLCPPSIEDV